MSTQRRKTWADHNAIPSGILGDTYHGITICEKNRGTVYERYKEGIQNLIDYLQTNYRSKGVKAVLYGIDDGRECKYAVFVESHFLRDTGDSTYCPHCAGLKKNRMRKR